MADKQKDTIPFFKKTWVLFIGTFVLLQLIFIAIETIGWAPDLKDGDGKLFERITESAIFSEWIVFYEAPQFNVFTVLFGIILLVPGIIGAIIDIFSRK